VSCVCARVKRSGCTAKFVITLFSLIIRVNTPGNDGDTGFDIP
jgi:hypothetical protein